ncbi:MAG: ABC transporter ATP-binding protein [Clostridia bacterium]|nr:ABC transporter ATP-binding protein [Clostridia bacterium]
MPRMMNNRHVAPVKVKDMKKSFGRLFRYLKTYMPLIIVSAALIIANTVFRIIGPNKLADITNILVEAVPEIGKNGEILKFGTPFEMSSIWNIAILLICLYAFGAVFSYIANVIIARVCFKMSQKMRSEISSKIDRLPLKKLDKTPYGDILSIVTNDVDMIGQTLHTSVSTLVGAIVLFFGSLIMMFITNWLMAIAAVCSTLIGFSLMMLIMKKSQKFFIQQQNSLGEINGIIEESYSGQTVIKTYNAKDEFAEKFEKVNEKLYQSGWKSQFISGTMNPIMGFVGNLGYVIVCILGAILFIKGKINFGVITAFMIYVRLFTNPLTQIAQAMTSVQSAAAASERVFNFLDEAELEPETDKDAKIPEIKGDVEFKNIKFGYDENREIIHGFSANIKAGQKVALVGPTGAGKTTIVNLLMRFYEVNSGKIKVDGISIQDMKRSQVRDIFSMVLQDTWLFEGTIRENLIYNKEGITTADLERVCEACGLDHFIKTLPDGFDTVLSDETSVSVGQKQLLTIARAMLQDTPILILDEATSNVDTRTEEVIQKAMDKLTENRTSFVIAHRLSTIKNADLILVLKDGDIIESGNHKELIKEKGFYADLYNSQFSLSGLDVEEE